MAIFPPQIPSDELERLALLRAGRSPAGIAGRTAAHTAATDSASASESAADKKRPVPRPPLAQALSEELRRFAEDESGFSFIDWAITVSVVSLALGFFIPDLWGLFGQVMAGVTNDVSGVAFRVKHLQ